MKLTTSLQLFSQNWNFIPTAMEIDPTENR